MLTFLEKRDDKNKENKKTIKRFFGIKYSRLLKDSINWKVNNKITKEAKNNLAINKLLIKNEKGNKKTKTNKEYFDKILKLIIKLLYYVFNK